MFPKALRRDVLILLAVKAVALTLIYFMFFGSSTKPEIGPQTLEARLLSIQQGNEDGHR